MPRSIIWYGYDVSNELQAGCGERVACSMHLFKFEAISEEKV